MGLLLVLVLLLSRPLWTFKRRYNSPTHPPTHPPTYLTPLSLAPVLPL